MNLDNLDNNKAGKYLIPPVDSVLPATLSQLCACVCVRVCACFVLYPRLSSGGYYTVGRVLSHNYLLFPAGYLHFFEE
jgi:hypothetical protein